ncbi:MULTISPECIES: hypothetical protein [unclassified Psychrobacter]|uniref:hypothetical protein n=1 Tax=unclassified Psychrobacter TaxID=196806 RepID=UPI0017878E88|nr:hypothetical protein [Psychrobacter sp. FME13]MBE0440928.1 hypothetical protein [Psychrobacter sp. FME13]
MRAKSVLRFYSQLARLLCKNSICHNDECELLFITNKNSLIKSVGGTQQGASTLILVLFVVVVLVTAMAGLILGHNLGYQRGYHSMNKETQQALTNSKEATQELEDLRLSNKIALNQAATAKQELAISLANVKKLRESKQELTTENKKLSQLNDVYAETLSGKGGMPLQVLGANINPLPENAFEYKFDIGMLANDGRSKLLTPTLILLNDDNFVEVPLDHPVDMIEGIVRIRGRFIMPSNFKPLQVKLSLEADGQEVEQLYDWKNGARVNNMPLSLLELPEVDDSPIEP